MEPPRSKGSPLTNSARSLHRNRKSSKDQEAAVQSDTHNLDHHDANVVFGSFASAVPDFTLSNGISKVYSYKRTRRHEARNAQLQA